MTELRLVGLRLPVPDHHYHRHTVVPMVDLRAQPGTRLPIWPSPQDYYEGKTTASQLEAEEEITERLSPYRLGGIKASAPPVLHRKAHLDFMAQWTRPMPAAYLAFDQNRSWLLYWVTQVYDLLGSPWGMAPQSIESDGTKDARTRVADTLLSFQHPLTGGFAGGPGQNSHLMAAYAAVMALAIVGGPADGTSAPSSAWDLIDRGKMYSWIMSLKQSDGSFAITQGGEVDVRCSYCALVISLALGICTPELIEGMDNYIVSCQTYEGGIASSVFPQGPDFILGEAHGGYAYCAIAAMAMLMRLKKSMPNSCGLMKDLEGDRLDLGAFYRWSIHLQGAPAEGGEFRGRTNKLVDGCYGWFAGAGLFSCLEAAMDVANPSRQEQRRNDWQQQESTATRSTASDSSWMTEVHEDSWLFDRASLQEYILICAQNEAPRGGLKDKPSTRPDAYHTCYNLSALSLCQHRVLICEKTYSALQQSYKAPTPTSDAGHMDEVTADKLKQTSAWLSHCYACSLGWTIDEDQDFVVGGEQNTVIATHPIFNVAFIRIKQMMDHFYGQM